MTEREYLAESTTSSDAMPSHSYTHLSGQATYDNGVPLAPNRRPASAEDDTDISNISNKTDSLGLLTLSKRNQYSGESTPDFGEFPHPDQSFDPENLYDTTKIQPSYLPPVFGQVAHTRRVPFLHRFERPIYRKVFVHLGLIVLAYPILLTFVVIARGRSLTFARLFVGVGCGVVGFFLGLSLVSLTKKFLEAATWATLIHQSRIAHAPGIKLKDLAACSDNATSAWTGLKLLWNRYMYLGSARKNRNSYDSRPWSLVIAFFLFSVIIAASFSFILARLVVISTTIEYATYEEVAVKGDLSTADLEQAALLVPAFDDFTLTWTLSPFSANGGLPPVVQLPYGNDTVYLSETTPSQLLSDGSGFGTFAANKTDASRETVNAGPIAANNNVQSVTPGNLLRYPRWGLRIKCKKIPDLDINVVTKSSANFSYVYTPRSVLQDLFSQFELDFPAVFNNPLNASSVLMFNDTLPPGLDVDKTARGVHFYDNGVAHSFHSIPLSMGQDGKGWQTIETVLVRLNTTYTPHASFSRKSDLSIPDVNGQPTFIGYDAAVCLELYEPWITDTYTGNGNPRTTSIVSKGNVVQDVAQEKLKGDHQDSSTRELNSTALANVYIIGHQNSVNQMIKDNGRDAYYVSSPIVVSFTNGTGPHGYTELSETFFAQARALSDASNVLPYFAGTGDLVARQFADRQRSDVDVNTAHMLTFLAIVLVLGLIAAFFVPKLPLEVPRRGFELYSWIAVFNGQELVQTHHDEGIQKHLDLNDIEEQMGERTFKYVL